MIMINASTKIILAAAAVTLSLAGSVSNAAPGTSNGAGGWEPSADHQENIVISLKTDPTAGKTGIPTEEELVEIREAAEPACVALQIGINLLKNTVAVGENKIPVTAADKVVLFTTLGGVQLINPTEDPDLTKLEILNDDTVCFAPYEDDDGVFKLTQSLNQLLGKFVDAEGEIIVCPLCAMTRGITPEEPAKMGNAEDIHNLFLYADKVIDF